LLLLFFWWRSGSLLQNIILKARPLLSNNYKKTPMSNQNLSSFARTFTPARVFAPRKGTALSTKDWLLLRADHAIARDAVFESIDLERDFRSERIDQMGLFDVSSNASNRNEYLLQPELGRQLYPADRERIAKQCPFQPGLQIILGDGLSAAALQKQGPPLLDSLWDEARKLGWVLGRPFLVHQARVGILNEIGNLLEPEIAILLIGERPGLTTADSLSAYLAYLPNLGHDDASRNLISNIHSNGVGIKDASIRIMALAQSMRSAKTGGITIKETLALGVRP